MSKTTTYKLGIPGSFLNALLAVAPDLSSFFDWRLAFRLCSLNGGHDSERELVSFVIDMSKREWAMKMTRRAMNGTGFWAEARRRKEEEEKDGPDFALDLVLVLERETLRQALLFDHGRGERDEGGDEWTSDKLQTGHFTDRLFLMSVAILTDNLSPC